MKDIRKHFPALNHYTYLDTAASGLVPEPVIAWRREQDEELLHKPLAFKENAPKVLDFTRQTIADFLNASVKKVALIPNFSFGLNSILEALPKNQKVAMLDNEYPSVSWPVRSRKFPICLIPMKPNLEENSLSIIETEKPDIFLFSMVQWLDGVKIDLDFLKLLKTQYPNLLLIADGTQYIGTEAFDFKNSAIDILVTSAYKWLTAGFGSGFLLCKQEAQARLSIKTIGFNSADTFESPWDSTRFIKHFEPGHLSSLNYGSIAEGIKFLRRMQPKECYENINRLAAKAKESFLELGLLPAYIENRKIHSSIFNIKGNAVLFKKLQQNNIACSMRGDGIRVSFHYYNNQEDLEKLLDILKE